MFRTATRKSTSPTASVRVELSSQSQLTAAYWRSPNVGVTFAYGWVPKERENSPRMVVYIPRHLEDIVQTPLSKRLSYNGLVFSETEHCLSHSLKILYFTRTRTKRGVIGPRKSSNAQRFENGGACPRILAGWYFTVRQVGKDNGRTKYEFLANKVGDTSKEYAQDNQKFFPVYISEHQTVFPEIHTIYVNVSAYHQS